MKSTLAHIRHGKALENGRAHPRAINEMLEYALPKITGANSLTEAWKSLFRSDDVVGIKVNCVGAPGQHTHHELVEAVIEGLASAGVSRTNIVLYEWKADYLPRANYTPARYDSDIHLISSEEAGFHPTQSLGTATVEFTRLLDDFTALINMPVLKDHALAGVTAALKNHYGSIQEPSRLHANNCDPFIADLNAAPQLREKARLIICDALRARYDGGPYDKTPDKWDHRGLLISTDPVAVDALGARIIEAKRRELGLPSLTERGTPPRWLVTATARGLGESSLEKIEIVEAEF